MVYPFLVFSDMCVGRLIADNYISMYMGMRCDTQVDKYSLPPLVTQLGFFDGQKERLRISLSDGPTEHNLKEFYVQT